MCTAYRVIYPILVTTTVVYVGPAKKHLREQLSSSRINLSVEERASANALIISHVREIVHAKVIAAYAPLETEPGGQYFLDALHHSAQEIWLPISLTNRTLLWSKYNGPQTITTGAFGISEPTGTRYTGQDLKHLDLILTPALAVDTRGFRLGKGGGYYDRALATMNATTAVCLYSQEVLAEVPTEPHDVAVDMAITPAGIRYF